LHHALLNIVMKKKYTIRIRVWIDEETGPFLGIGRVILLEKIKETGSITNAAKAIKMSYRQAWQLVEDMNKRSNLPLVEKILGGKNGSGTILTTEGERVISEFHKLEKEIKKYVELKSKKIAL
jgi:molybdate transport system regulatory protein